MEKEQVYESAAETAKKIRSTLKRAFPSVSFSVKSSTYSMGSSVYVKWIDGPLDEDVDAILDLFKSGTFDGMQDMYTSKGYLWEGKIVIGAKYVDSSRSLSPERRAVIEAKLKGEYQADAWGCVNKHDWVKAEKLLIESGELQGHPSQLPEPLAANPEGSPSAASIGGKVIEFPVQAVRDRLKADELQAERLMQSLTPEQRLKLQVLQSIFGLGEVAGMLHSGKLSIDEIFKITADRIFG